MTFSRLRMCRKTLIVVFPALLLAVLFTKFHQPILDRLLCSESTTFEENKYGSYELKLVDSHAGSQLCEDHLSVYLESKYFGAGGWDNFFRVSRSYLLRDDRPRFAWVDRDHLLVIVDDIAQINLSLLKIGDVNIHYALSERVGAKFKSKEKIAYEAQIRLTQSGQFASTNSLEYINNMYSERSDLHLKLMEWFYDVSKKSR